MDLTAIGLSALRTAALGEAVRANNVANVNSDGFRAKRLEREDQPTGGVRASGLTASPEPPVPGGSNVDLAKEFTDNAVDSAGYKAGLKLLQVADEQLGQALDLKA